CAAAHVRERIPPWLASIRVDRRLELGGDGIAVYASRQASGEGFESARLTAAAGLFDTARSARWGASCPRQGNSPTQSRSRRLHNLLPAWSRRTSGDFTEGRVHDPRAHH